MSLRVVLKEFITHRCLILTFVFTSPLACVGVLAILLHMGMYAPPETLEETLRDALTELLRIVIRATH